MPSTVFSIRITMIKPEGIGPIKNYPCDICGSVGKTGTVRFGNILRRGVMCCTDHTEEEIEKYRVGGA